MVALSNKYTKCPLQAPSGIYYPPITIGHRGTSFYIPEHTLAGYRLALELGTEYIEPDLVPTKDEVLIAMHDIDLNITTNVQEVFPTRYRTNVTLGGKTRSGYFTYDFTLEEIKQLRVKQRIEDTPARSRYFDWEFDIPSLDEIVDLLYDWNTNVTSYIHRHTSLPKAGLYAELKHPKWILEDSSIQVSDLLLKNLRENEKANSMFFNTDCITMLESKQQFMVPPLVIQCFEVGTLVYLRQSFIEHGDDFNNVVPPNVYLVAESICETSAFFSTLSKHRDDIDGVGPDKACVLKNDSFVDSVVNTLYDDAVIHPWTERLEIEFVNETFDDAASELSYLFCHSGIHGIFAENVDVAIRVARLPCTSFGRISNSVSMQQNETCSSSFTEWMRLVQGLCIGLFVGWFFFGFRSRDHDHGFRSIDRTIDSNIIT